MILNLNTLHYLSEIYIDIPDEECIKTERKQFFTINDWSKLQLCIVIGTRHIQTYSCYTHFVTSPCFYSLHFVITSWHRKCCAGMSLQCFVDTPSNTGNSFHFKNVHLLKGHNARKLLQQCPGKSGKYLAKSLRQQPLCRAAHSFLRKTSILVLKHFWTV